MLILTDLGDLPNLSDIFGALGGQTFGEEPLKADNNLFSSSDQHLSTEQGQFFQDIGDRLGRFFARLHRPEICARVLDRHTLRYFQVYEIRNIVLELAMKPVAPRIKLFPEFATREEADNLGDALVEDFLRVTSEDELFFIHGDCWTGGILVSPPTATTTQNMGNLGIIDWEFALLNRGPMATLLNCSRTSNSAFLPSKIQNTTST